MGKARFEDEIKRLEEVVAKIESGEVGLDDSIKLCEEAAALVKSLKKKLSEAELRVKELTRNSEGELEVDGEIEEKLC